MRWHRRRRGRRTGELGRLLDAYPGPGATLAFSVDGRAVSWLEASGCVPTWSTGTDRPTFDVEALLADAAAAGLHPDQLIDSLARIEVPEHAAALARAGGRLVEVPSPARLAREAARAAWPHLIVRHHPLEAGRWWFEVRAPDGRTLAPLPPYEAPTVLSSQAAAFEVGLAHLAVCSAAWAIDVHGAELPPDFVRVLPAA